MRLVERDTELAELEAHLERATTGDGALVLIEGPAGIGKTALLAAARERGLASSMTVLYAKGGPVERGLAWGVVRELFVPIVSALDEPARAEAFEGAARHAMPVLSVQDQQEPTPRTDVTGPALHGLYWLLVNLMQRSGPLLLAMDDGHWCDDPSLRFLGYCAARLEGLPILVVVTVRPEASQPARNAHDLLRGAATAIVRPGTLSRHASRLVICEVFEEEPEDGFVDACHAATSGNPLLLRELVASLARDGVQPRNAAAQGIPRHDPRAVARSVLVQLGHLAQDASDVAVGASVMGGAARLDEISALMEVDEARAAAAADTLTGVGVVLPGSRVEFAHPVVRAAVYDDIPPHRRSALHLRAAHLLSDRRALPDVIAAHLLSVDPSGDRWVITALCEAAEAAIDRGAPDSAATYLRRALDERCDADVEARLLDELGTALFAAGEVADSFEASERALELELDQQRRASNGIVLARRNAMMFTGHGFELLDALAGDLDPGSTAAKMVADEMLALAPAYGPRAWEAAKRHAEIRASGRPIQDPLLLAGMAVSAMTLLEPADVVADLGRRAVAAGVLQSQVLNYIVYAAAALGFSDCFDEATQIWDLLFAAAEHRGSPLIYATASCYKADLDLRLGAIADAEASASAAIRIFAEGGISQVLPYALLADALVERDEIGEAREALASAPPRPATPLWPHFVFAWSEAKVTLAASEPDRALERLRVFEDPANPFAVNPTAIAWRSTAALAHHALGKSEPALELALDEAERARAIKVPSAVARACRTAGMLSRDEAALALLEESCHAVRESPARLEHARSHVELGAALRRSGRRRDARDRLIAGLEDARQCGATRLMRRAADELRAAGARPRRDEFRGRNALTASELRIATLAATGKTNTEIAQQLFITLKTVETHLTHVYQKLDITGRRQLSANLDDGLDAAAEMPD